MVTIFNILSVLIALYALVGIVFAFTFVTKGVGKIDPSAKAGTWGFRVLIFPGAAALWPILLKRWRKGGGPPIERNAHRDAAGGQAS